MKKAVTYMLSAALWGVCFLLGTLIWLDHLGGYKTVSNIMDERGNKVRLYESSYFGKPLQENPYKRYSVQYLNPFYMFSLPWTEQAIARANSVVVTLNNSGFRNSFLNGAARKAAILGGSTAFGTHASNDENTLASALNKIQEKYEFHNFGVPSWNSHQEMVAYTKIPFKTDFVIAFSGSNDFAIAMRYCKAGKAYPPATPESFEYLAEMTDDIRGTKNVSIVSSLFPHTSRKLAKLFTAAESGSVAGECRPRISEAAEAFVSNQQIVRDVAVARGSSYLLALQPHLYFLQDRQSPEHELRMFFYDKIVKSDFCRQSRCVDLSRVFAGASPLHIDEVPDNPQKAIFTDRVHLTDRGFQLVAKLLAPSM